MLKELHSHVHRMNALQARRKKLTAPPWERNFNIMLNVANDKQPHCDGSINENGNIADAFCTGILSDMAIKYYYSPAEYHFATTNTPAIFMDYASFYADQIVNEAKKSIRAPGKRLSGHGSLAGILAKGCRIPQMPDEPPCGSRLGNAYVPDEISLNILPSAFVRTKSPISWTATFKTYLMRIHQKAIPSSKIWSAIITNPFDIEREVNYRLRRGHNNAGHAENTSFAAKFLHANECFEIKFISVSNDNSDELQVNFAQLGAGPAGANSRREVLHGWLSAAERLSIAAKLNIFCILRGITGRQLDVAITESTAYTTSKLNVAVAKENFLGAAAASLSHKDTVSHLRQIAFDLEKMAWKRTRAGQHAAAVQNLLAATNYDKENYSAVRSLAYAFGGLGFSNCELRYYNLAINRFRDDFRMISNRGVVKHRLGDSHGAMRDFMYVNRKDSELRKDNPYLYFTHIYDAMKLFDKAMLYKLFRLLHIMEKFSVSQWRDRADVYHGDKMHYTGICTAFALARGHRFRLKCASAMDDSAEGSVFRARVRKRCEQLGKNTDAINEILSYIGTSSGNVYLGSFDCSGGTDFGREHMWEQYGKHEGLAHAGCALIFDGVTFHKGLGYGWNQQMNDECDDDVPISADECCLYRVTYDEELQQQSVGDFVAILFEILEDRQAALVKDIVRATLDRVRFLFKDASYAREDEARMLVWRVDKPRVGGVVQLDKKGSKYVECPLSIFPKAILLGKAVPAPNALVSNLKTHKLFAQKEVSIHAV